MPIFASIYWHSCFLITNLTYNSNGFCTYSLVLQGWPEDELPLFINGTLDTGNHSSVQNGWQLDIPVVVFSFGFCVVCLLILVQVCETRAIDIQADVCTIRSMPTYFIDTIC